MAIALFNGTRPEGILVYVNEITGGHFGWVILLSIFVASYMGLGFLRAQQALAGAAFLTGVIAALFYTLGIINNLVLFLSALLIMLTIVILKNSKDL